MLNLNGYYLVVSDVPEPCVRRGQIQISIVIEGTDRCSKIKSDQSKQEISHQRSNRPHIIQELNQSRTYCLY